MVGMGILLLAGWWGMGQYGGMAVAKDKKEEGTSVKVRFLVEGGKGQVEAGPVTEVPTVSRSDKEWNRPDPRARP